MTETHIPQASMIETPPSAEGSYEEYREYLDRAKVAVEDFIEKNDIDPEDVIVAGYSTDRPKSEGQEHVNEDGSPQYFFGDLVSLSAPVEERGDAFDADEVLDSLVVNPVYYASKKATPGHGAIGIYSKSKLDELSGGAEEYDEEFGTSLYTTLNEEAVELSKYGEILVGEKLAIDSEEKKLGKYETGYDSEPSWDQMDELLSVLDLSKDPTSRANELVHHFTRGKDVEGFIRVIHQYTVPDTLTTELKHQSFSVDTDGNRTNDFAMPEERPLIFTFAARQIQELAVKRIEGDVLGDQAYLDAVADIVALATVYAHSYNDGNGRTSRIAAEVIRSGASDDEAMRMLATNRSVGVKGKNWLDKGYAESFRLNGYIPRDKQMSWAAMFEGLAMKDVPLSDIAEREVRRNQLIEAPTSMGGVDMVQGLKTQDTGR